MILNRFIINKVRYILEDVLCPCVRDSVLFYLLLRIVYGARAKRLAEFRSRAATMSADEMVSYYKLFPALLDTTDVNQACLDRIASTVVGEEIVDVGCGRGWLANHLSQSTHKRVCGVDFIVPNDLRTKYPDVRFIEAALQKLPFADHSFDTVVCTHTLEHVLDVGGAVAELRRICKHRLIIVVPSEREYKYSFNLHLSFFPYTHSLLNRLAPLPPVHSCEVLDGDIFYMEDMRGVDGP